MPTGPNDPPETPDHGQILIGRDKLPDIIASLHESADDWQKIAGELNIADHRKLADVCLARSIRMASLAEELELAK